MAERRRLRGGKARVGNGLRAPSSEDTQPSLTDTDGGAALAPPESTLPEPTTTEVPIPTTATDTTPFDPKPRIVPQRVPAPPRELSGGTCKAGWVCLHAQAIEALICT